MTKTPKPSASKIRNSEAGRAARQMPVTLTYRLVAPGPIG
jgi:hypothetical protein